MKPSWYQWGSCGKHELSNPVGSNKALLPLLAWVVSEEASGELGLPLFLTVNKATRVLSMDTTWEPELPAQTIIQEYPHWAPMETEWGIWISTYLKIMRHCHPILYQVISEEAN